MQENILFLFGGILWLIIFIRGMTQYRRIHTDTDGVESIDGITYLIKDTDVSYVMYKLNSTCISRIIEDKKFEVVNEKEGILTFGGINEGFWLKGSERDMNIGAAYRIKCEQRDQDVIMKVSFEKREFRWFSPSTADPGFMLNQAYHRFFKEILDVQVLK